MYHDTFGVLTCVSTLQEVLDFAQPYVKVTTLNTFLIVVCTCLERFHLTYFA